MTGIDLDDLARPEPKRDRWGRPLITPANGGKPKGYTRVTTVAKTLDGADALIPWKATLAVVGSRVRPGLAASWDALIAKTNGNPWYAGKEAKDECKALVEESARAGGSSDRAEIGTALHKLTELHDLGTLNRATLPPAALADVDAYHQALTAAGVTVEPGWVEAFLVLDDYEVAGTTDRIYRLPDGRLVIGDVKTPANLDFSWQSICVQLATYSRGVPYNVADDTRGVMPPVDTSVGLIVHLPAGEARCTLHLVDLVAGWEMFQRSMEVRRWRNRKDLATPYVPELDDHSARRTELQARIDALRAFDPDSLTALQVAFAEAGVPTLKQFDGHTAEQLDTIDRIVTAVEAKHAPFDPSPVAAPVPPSPTPVPPPVLARRMADEGDTLDDDTLAAIRARYAGLDETGRKWIGTLQADALVAGLTFHLRDNPTVRRLEILRFCVEAWRVTDGDDEYVRTVVHHVTGEDFARQVAHPLGAVVGALTIDEARRAADALAQLDTGALVVKVDDSGTLVLDTPAAA